MAPARISWIDDEPARFARELEAIAFNGGTAAKEGRRALVEDAKVRLYDLPSSSGLNATAPGVKLEAWKILLPHLR